MSYDGNDYIFDDSIDSSNDGHDVITYADIDYDRLSSTFSQAILNDIYPSSSAVSVFENVLKSKSLLNPVHYVVIPGSSSSEAYLYYSETADVSGTVVTLSSPVTVCHYYSVFDSGSRQTRYRYDVSQVGTYVVSPGNSLMYTDMLPGYPDISPSVRDPVFLFIGLALLLVLVFLFLKKGGR